jgi:ABC-type polysaccharide/polyol phosphate transport system ATPase subunit
MNVECAYSSPANSTNLECASDVTNPKTKEVKPILSDISGCAPSGEVLAIMGSSGAGKTTLLNLLGGSLVDHGNTTVHGRILANGECSVPTEFQLTSGQLACLRLSLVVYHHHSWVFAGCAVGVADSMR